MAISVTPAKCCYSTLILIIAVSPLIIPAAVKSAAEDLQETKSQVLRGRVVTESGKPVGGVNVSLFADKEARNSGQSTITDDDGRYRFNQIRTSQPGGFKAPRGRYRTTFVRFEHPELVPADGIHSKRLTMKTVPGKEIVLDRTMACGGRVRGVVIDDQTGTPATNLALRIRNDFLTPRRRSPIVTIYATTGEKGQFATPALPTGKYTVEIDDKNFRPAEVLDEDLFGKPTDRTVSPFPPVPNARSHNDSDDPFGSPFAAGTRYPKIGQADIKPGSIIELKLTTSESPLLQDPFTIAGQIVGEVGKPFKYGSVSLQSSERDKDLRVGDIRVTSDSSFQINFGPYQRGTVTSATPYGVGNVDVSLTGFDERRGHKLIGRTPSEPLRVTDDPTMPELQDGIRYIRPGKPLRLSLTYAKIGLDPNSVQNGLIVKLQDKDNQPVGNAIVMVFDGNQRDIGRVEQFGTVSAKVFADGAVAFDDLKSVVPHDLPFRIAVHAGTYSQKHMPSIDIRGDDSMYRDPLVSVTKDDRNNLVATFTLRIPSELNVEVVDAESREPINQYTLEFRDKRTQEWVLAARIAGGEKRLYTTIVREMKGEKFRATRSGYFPSEFPLTGILFEPEQQQRKAPGPGPKKQRVMMRKAPDLRFKVTTPDGKAAGWASIEYVNPPRHEPLVNPHPYSRLGTTNKATGQTTIPYPAYGELLGYRISHPSGSAELSLRNLPPAVLENGREIVEIGVRLKD